ncbi:response regulator [Frigidibacter oleivorans]|uniref:response regulator n=1 Tax=Frigidibacter oleivorans TaxID=2487129 RepID=UPI000F8CA2AC|nr:response regulator [Frigidibacter oleivorans]
MTEGTSTDISALIGAELPYLRRYARALTGSQGTGDRYAVATLEAILVDRSVFESGLSPRVALFRAFHAIWSSAGSPVAEEGSDTLEARAQVHLSGLTRNTREALLLRTIEEMRFDQIAQIMTISQAEAEELVEIAMREMERSVLGRVMIIEDETIIAMDIQSIVQAMGHEVVGVARTRDQAVALGDKERPDLILADIQLADNSSGIDAVNDLLTLMGDVPVIFITAFPERLLTGERPEPAFLISKPYLEEQVRSAVSQAMFFASTESLAA